MNEFAPKWMDHYPCPVLCIHMCCDCNSSAVFVAVGDIHGSPFADSELILLPYVVY
jgi:hypothetical protein